VKTRRAPKVFLAHGGQCSAKSGKTPVRFMGFSLADAAPHRALWGLFDRRERWSLSWRGRLILVLLGFSTAILLVLNVQPFLAETYRVNSNILVVEGWIHEYAIWGAAEECRTGSYQRVFTTGGPVTGKGHYINDYQTSASVGAELLKNAGVPPEFVQMVPSRVMDRDRTYGSAVALREWFRGHNMTVHSVNVVTENAHARRTRFLFEKALGKNVAVGIIAVANPDYDKGRWWWYSEGVKDVGSEALAYAYARLFFHPSEPPRMEQAPIASEGDTRQ
jgi:uncharacterized SAM-binding protein YcdF (DUF218 family)